MTDSIMYKLWVNGEMTKFLDDLYRVETRA